MLAEAEATPIFVMAGLVLMTLVLILTYRRGYGDREKLAEYNRERDKLEAKLHRDALERDWQATEKAKRWALEEREREASEAIDRERREVIDSAREEAQALVRSTQSQLQKIRESPLTLAQDLKGIDQMVRGD